MSMPFAGARRAALIGAIVPFVLASADFASAQQRWTRPWRKTVPCDVCPPARIAPPWSDDAAASSRPNCPDPSSSSGAPHQSDSPRRADSPLPPASAEPFAPNDPAAPNDPTAPNANPQDAPQDPGRQLTNPDQVFNNPANSPGASTQAASNAASAAPNSIGDFLGTVAVSTHYTGLAGQIGGSAGALKLVGPYGAVAGRQKFVENQNVTPIDRVFVNYSYFGDAPLTPPGMSVNRWTYGIEKTVFDGDGSIEVRLPTATTLDSDIKTSQDNLSGSNFELGNLNIAGKVVLARTQTTLVTGGLTVTLPTADDLRLYTETTGFEALRYENRSVHLLPFLGMLCTPSDRTFTQMTLQIDFDVNGNPVLARTLDGFREIGVAHDSTYLYATWSAGYWLTQERDRGRLVGGIAPIVELHYNRTLRDADDISFADAATNIGIGTRSPDGSGNNDELSFEALNVTVGLFALLNPNASITAGYAVPFAGANHEDQFNGEARLLFNYYFGGNGGFGR